MIPVQPQWKEEDVTNLRTALRQGLQHRHYGQAVRLEVSSSCAESLASFLLAHFGGEAVSGELGGATWAVLGLGLVTGLPLIWAATRKRTAEKR